MIYTALEYMKGEFLDIFLINIKKTRQIKTAECKL